MGQLEISQPRSGWKPCTIYISSRKGRWKTNACNAYHLHFHIVSSTKDRHPFVADNWRNRLHEYLGGLVRSADGIPESIGGTADPVHVLAGLRATHSIATFVKDIKQTSSRWIHETVGVKNFAWQQGYGAVTVSVSNTDAVREYIKNQAEHHRTKTFQEEYVAFLKKHGVAYDEKYLW